MQFRTQNNFPKKYNLSQESLKKVFVNARRKWRKQFTFFQEKQTILTFFRTKKEGKSDLNQKLR
jgi:hypothetical protein